MLAKVPGCPSPDGLGTLISLAWLTPCLPRLLSFLEPFLPSHPRQWEEKGAGASGGPAWRGGPCKKSREKNAGLKGEVDFLSGGAKGAGVRGLA